MRQFLEQKECAHRFRVVNLSGLHHLYTKLEREESGFDLFVLFGLSCTLPKTRRQEDVHRLVQESRAGVELK